MKNNSELTVIIFKELPSLVHSSGLTVFIRNNYIAHRGSRITRNKDRRILNFYFAPSFQCKSFLLGESRITSHKIR